MRKWEELTTEATESTEGKGEGLTTKTTKNTKAGRKGNGTWIHRMDRIRGGEAPKGANEELGMFRFGGWRVERLALGKAGKEKTTEATESTEGKGEGLTTKGTINTKIIYSLTTLRLMPSGNRMELRSNRK